MDNINLTFDTPREDISVGEALAALGGERTPELGQVVERVREMDPRIRDWLAEHPERLDDFVRDPVEVLTREFPELEIPPALAPAGRRPIEGRDRITFQVAGTQPSSPALELLAKVWQWVATSPQNTAAFAASPEAVIRAVGAQEGAHFRTINLVSRAMDTVLGVGLYELEIGAINKAVATGVFP